MKLTNASLLALLLPAASARFAEHNEADRVQLFPDGLPDTPKSTEKYHIELSPGDTRWVTEDEKWELRRVSSSLMSPLYSLADRWIKRRSRTANASSTSQTIPTSAPSAQPLLPSSPRSPSFKIKSTRY